MAKNTTNRPVETAHAAYAKRRADIARLLDVLQMELEALDQKHGAEPANWGPATTLQRAKHNLVLTVAMLSNKEVEEVQAFLEDAR